MRPFGGKLSLSSASLPGQTLMEDVRLAVELGLDGLGISLAKVDAGGLSVDEVHQVLLDNGLRATMCGPAVFSILPLPAEFGGASMFAAAAARREPSERVRLICDALPRLAALDPLGVVVAPGAVGPADDIAASLAVIREGLAEIADAAAALHQRVAFELIGERRGSPLHTLPDIVSFIDEVARPNVDVLFDVFHSWCEPGLHEHLRQYHDRIVSVDLNDVRVEERSGFDRELPGRGRGRAPDIVATLLDAGYCGWWNLEVFSDDGTFGNDFPDSYWKLPAAKFGAAMYDASVQVFESATARRAP